MKIFCCKCNSIATWQYVPGADEWYCCDKHVPRGCTCNIKYHDHLNDEDELDPVLDSNGNPIEETDEQGRLLPCCEWDYNPFGHDEFDEDDYYRFLEETQN